MEPPTISPAVARRYLTIRHRLAPPRDLPGEPASILTILERIGSLQFDPIDVTGRNHDLVLASRIRDYRRAMTDDLLYRDRVVYETYNKGLSIVPTAELPWYRSTWDLHRAAHEGGAFDEHAPLVAELLARIRSDGPLSPTDLEPRPAIDWYWRPTNQVRAILEALAEAGILGIRRRDGNRRVYDLVERLFPAELLAERRPLEAQRRHRLLSRYRGHGLLGTTGAAEVMGGGTGTAADRRVTLAGLLADGSLVAVRVDGLRGERWLPTADLPLLEQAHQEVAEGRPPGGREAGVAFLAPLDPLVWDRDLLARLFDFDYRWEVYVPAAKRRWGYYVLPILAGDRLVGRIEPRADRSTGTLRILGLWWEPGFEPLAERGFVAAFAEALDAHRGFTGMRRIALPRTVRHRELTAEVRRRIA